MKAGVLPDWRIKELINQGAILGADPKLVNSSSLDMLVGAQQWKLLGSFLPLENQKVEDMLQSSDIVDHGSSDKTRFYIENLQPYVMKLVESLRLPKSINARVFNKSGRGRIGISMRGLTDGMPQFDMVREGYHGDLYAEITPTAFPIVTTAGQTAIPQIRFYEGQPAPLSGSELEMLLNKFPILTDDSGQAAYRLQEKNNTIRTGKLTFTADIPSEGLIAYIAKRDRRKLDLAKSGYYAPTDYFQEEVRKANGRSSLLIHPGDFVLIRSKEHARLPPMVAAEIDEYSPELGDMKSHYAGLINASHGYDPDERNAPSRIVFEIRARDTPILIQDGQPLAKFNLYRMWEQPEGNYASQNFADFDLRSILPNIFRKD